MKWILRSFSPGREFLSPFTGAKKLSGCVPSELELCQNLTCDAYVLDFVITEINFYSFNDLFLKIFSFFHWPLMALNLASVSLHSSVSVFFCF